MPDTARACEIDAAWLEYRPEPLPYLARRVLPRLSAEQNHRCCHCGVRTNEATKPAAKATVEHIIPRSHGGPDQYFNLAMACRACNMARGDNIHWRYGDPVITPARSTRHAIHRALVAMTIADEECGRPKAAAQMRAAASIVARVMSAEGMRDA